MKPCASRAEHGLQLYFQASPRNHDPWSSTNNQGLRISSTKARPAHHKPQKPQHVHCHTISSHRTPLAPTRHDVQSCIFDKMYRIGCRTPCYVERLRATMQLRAARIRNGITRPSGRNHGGHWEEAAGPSLEWRRSRAMRRGVLCYVL